MYRRVVYNSAEQKLYTNNSVVTNSASGIVSCHKYFQKYLN